VALTGCGGPSRDEAVQTAGTWLQAVADGEFDRACDLMHPSAVAVLGRRTEETECPEVVEAFAGSFGEGDLKGILDGGLEGEGEVKDDELGVFPASGARELQVILMQHRDGAWKVGSTTLSP
jgi:hypothetical protein